MKPMQLVGSFTLRLPHPSFTIGRTLRFLYDIRCKKYLFSLTNKPGLVGKLFRNNLTVFDHQNIALFNKKSEKDTYVLKDGKMYFTNWAIGEPKEDKVCVVTSDIVGFDWVSKDCKEQAFILCQIDTRTVGGILNKQGFSS